MRNLWAQSGLLPADRKKNSSIFHFSRIDYLQFRLVKKQTGCYNKHCKLRKQCLSGSFLAGEQASRHFAFQAKTENIPGVGKAEDMLS
jgi:hypothetical protein